MELHRLPSYIFLLFLVFVDGEKEMVFGNEQNQGMKKPAHRTNGGFRPTKLFVFGDSYSDTGNNPRSVASSWKTPYGVTFPGKPAGRYSDGRVLTDYVARFMGLKTPLPYQFREYKSPKLRSGINFAYGGTGVFDTGNLMPNMTTQIGFFEKLIKDSVYTKRDLESSLALVTVSGNDYGAYTSGGGSDQGLRIFTTRVVNQMEINLKKIQDLGIRRVLVNFLQPLGCLPQSTVFFSFQQCNNTQNLFVIFHNQLLHQVVAKLNNAANGFRIQVLDFYNSFTTVLKNKGGITGSSKFNTPLKPCCIATNKDANCGSLDKKGNKLYTVCNDPDSTFFWDTVHPTQAGWRAVYLTLRSSLNRIAS